MVSRLYEYTVTVSLTHFHSNVCIKLASSDFPVSSWQMNFVRGVVPLFVIVPIICWNKKNILGPPDIKTRLRMVAIACTSGTMLMCVFEGIDRLPFGDYSAISFSSPVFVMILSIFLLKDRFGIYRSIMGILLTVGVVIISRPTALFPTDSEPASPISNLTTSLANHEIKKSTDILGIAFALTGAVLSAWITILVRYVGYCCSPYIFIWITLQSVIF